MRCGDTELRCPGRAQDDVRHEIARPPGDRVMPADAGQNDRGFADLLDRRVESRRRNRAVRLLRDPALTFRRKLLPSHVERFETFWGQPMTGISSETVAATIMTSGYFEEALTRTMLSLVRPGMTVIDVGAHIGYFTLLAARLVGRSGNVLSLEPTPGTCALLLANVSAFPNVIVRSCAAWNETTTLPLRDFGGGFSAFNSFTVPRTLLRGHRVVEVEAVPLDAELERQGLRPDFIKIDVESAERQVLEGLAGTLERTRPILTLEVGDVGVPGVWSTAELIAFMTTRFRYDAFEWLGRSLARLRPRAQWSYDNLVFAPRERRIG